ncbi:hypothetical protein F5Y17DRAFT_2768 [Xylariaceae sp. FL0594]|nr:hypothetical protein F5Y17DRAFT_2768 [Xylariaceae sp. FL0594]
MSAPQKTSRWGSFLSQAVAGVEARLDNILAEDDGSKKSLEHSAPATAPAVAVPAPPTRTGTPSKSTNDRLQERLARAVASRNAASAGKKSSEIASTSSSPRPSSDSSRLPIGSTTQAVSPRTSLSVDDSTNTTSAPVTAAEVAPSQTQAELTIPGSTLPANGPSSAVTSPRSSLQIEPENPEKEVAPETASKAEAQPLADNGGTSELYVERIALLEKALEEAQAQHQEDLHNNTEQMDALQAKLQYLAREASQEARNAASDAPAGSLSKKLAEKDDQIAQLMLEGQKLASTEQNYRSVIKKLRTQVATGEKELNEQKIWRQRAERELAEFRRRLDASADLEKANEELQGLLSRAKKEADKLKLESEAKDRSIADLKNQLQEESEKASLLAAKADTHQREAGQKKVKELEDTIAALEVEKGLAADRARLQIAEAREKADRASERAHAVELELKGEVQTLERKLEALRASAEEASSGAVGDAQVKLLRQIESLQTQYSIASENWQGMEASLQARAVSLEKERDEALRRESDMRRKARETASRAKRQEEEVEDMRTQLANARRELKSYQAQLDTLKTRAEQAEAALADTKAELTRQQASSRNDRGDRTDNDRRNWPDDPIAASFQNRGRPESPLLLAPQRTFSGDNFLGLQNFPSRLRKTSAPSSNGEPSPSDRASLRRPSVQPPIRSPLFSLSSFTAASTPSLAGGQEFPTLHAAQVADQDDALETLERSASPQHMLQDMMSSSTMTAGPSVQLVERMSAAIRRLESERVAAKEELARISGQRDEARGEIVALIRELETNKGASKRVAELEKEVAEINERYQTTLEMLGEKSELVEELRADVQDVKAMYRDLVERTIK